MCRWCSMQSSLCIPVYCAGFLVKGWLPNWKTKGMVNVHKRLTVLDSQWVILGVVAAARRNVISIVILLFRTIIVVRLTASTLVLIVATVLILLVPFSQTPSG